MRENVQRQYAGHAWSFRGGVSVRVEKADPVNAMFTGTSRMHLRVDNLWAVDVFQVADQSEHFVGQHRVVLLESMPNDQPVKYAQATGQKQDRRGGEEQNQLRADRAWLSWL